MQSSLKALLHHRSFGHETYTYECTEEINENEKYEKSEKQLMLIDKF
jgi:hypothetical protein